MKTPKQIVTANFPQAKCERQINSTYTVFTPEKILGSGSSPNKAWADAAKNIEDDLIIKSYYAKKKLSKRRQRILDKAHAGLYNFKSADESLNILKR